MASSIFPTAKSGIFVPSLWQLPAGQFTREYADLNYLKFPIAQGSQIIPKDLTVSGTTNLGATNISDSSLIITDGTTTNTINKTGYTTKNTVQNITHYLNFSDSSTTGIGAIQKSANFSVNPSTGTLTASGLVTATGGLTTGASSVLTTGTGITTLVGATTATGVITLNGGIKALATQNIKGGIVVGSSTSGTATGTVSFGFTFATAPYVIATIITGAGSNMVQCVINNITTTGFSYSKTYINLPTGGGGAAGEWFNWIAFGI